MLRQVTVSLYISTISLASVGCELKFPYSAMLYSFIHSFIQSFCSVLCYALFCCVLDFITGISPQAVPHLVLSPPPSPDPGSGSDPSASASAVDSQATLQLALHMSRQLDQLIAQLQRQDTVIAHQQVRLARQEADIQAAARIAAGTAAGTGGVTGSTEEQDQEQEQDQDQDNSDQRDKPSSETVYVDI